MWLCRLAASCFRVVMGVAVWLQSKKQSQQMDELAERALAAEVNFRLLACCLLM